VVAYYRPHSSPVATCSVNSNRRLTQYRRHDYGRSRDTAANSCVGRWVGQPTVNVS